MKIFSYDPKTGNRGEQIDNVQVSSWASCSTNYLISKGQLKDLGWVTGDFGPNTEVTIHEDAGLSDHDGKPVSYRRDQWVCFCTGKWKTGEGEMWCWVVLPSEQDIQAAAIE